MGLMLNRRRVMGGNNLPYDAEIEWLQSPVGSGIVIPSTFNCNKFTRYVAHFQFQSSIVQQRVFFTLRRSVYENGEQRIACAQNNDWQPTSLTWSTECVFDLDTINKKTYFYNKNMSLLATVTHDSVGNAGSDLRLFQNTTQIQSANIKCWSFKAYINNELALDLIPVRIDTIGYMYDKVSGQLFGNVGTVNFILGPDV